MGAKRGYGEGSVYQRKSDGLWIGAVAAGWAATGKPRRVTVSGKTEGEAKRKLTRKIAALRDEGASAANPRTTVKQWADDWLPIVERTLRPQSYLNTRTAIRRWIVPAIGSKRLCDLEPGDVRKVLARMREHKLATSSQRRHHSALIQLLKAARAEGHAVPLRVLEVPPPSANANDRTDMPLVDALKVLAVAATKPDASRWVAALLNGTRQGESLGLTWGELDFDKGLVPILWQLQPLPYNVAYDRDSGFRVPDGYEARQIEGRWHLTRPKTAAGERVLPMLPWLKTSLLGWREVCPDSPLGLVWPNPDGSPRDPKDDDAAWYALQAEAGVHHPTRLKDNGSPAPFTIHETRHTTVALLLEAGVQPPIIIAIVGHATFASTRPYLHVKTDQLAAAMEKVATLLELTEG